MNRGAGVVPARVGGRVHRRVNVRNPVHAIASQLRDLAAGNDAPVAQLRGLVASMHAARLAEPRAGNAVRKCRCTEGFSAPAASGPAGLRK